VTAAAEQTITAIQRWRSADPATLVVAIDGYGASGKTTLAGEVAVALDAAVLHTDDHLHEARACDDPRPMAQYYDWTRLRRDVTAAAGPVVLLEGVSSAAPALADLVGRAVFVQTPEPLRLERLHDRIGDAEWDRDWLAAERVYFASRPPGSFDLIVSGA
jgi:uridine kinase